MTDSWQRLKDVFDAAAELPPDQRAVLLDGECAGDAALRAEVESLLTAHDAGGSAVEAIVADAARVLAAGGPDPAVGRRIGRWEIASELGRGGMGTVYLVTRADEVYRGRAALKLVRGVAFDRGLERRFLAERQILASFEHPNIARLLDGGATEDGLPYLVMEHVEGDPIDAYCDRERLDVRDRVRLVRTVCRAVGHAHQRLVVHRDLKPSNILVTPGGHPKLLDFGIAKLLDPDGADHTVAMTVDGARLLTPAYAAPEQVRGEPVTTATDVYALGVLLYRLLTGVLPYRLSNAGPQEIERAICDTDPPRPSTAATRTTSTDAAVDTAYRRRQLRGDLDNIVLKAIAKEPGRRYPSVGELDEDLGRYLADQPVLARPSTWRYRAGKFLRRNRRTVATVAAAVAVVVATVVMATGRLARERDRAELEAATAREVTRFLTTMFGQASPYVARGEVVTATDLLEQGARDIDDLADRPELQVALLEAMGTAFSEIGDHADAVTLLERAVRLRRELPDADPVGLAETLDRFAVAARVATRFVDAERAARECLAIRRRHLGPRHREIGVALNHLGVLMYDVGRLTEARDLQTEALALFDALGEGEGTDAADAMNNLAIALDRLGDHREAEVVHRRAIALNRELLGLDHPNTATGIANLGLVLVSLGRYAEAEGLFRQSLAIRRRVLGDRDWRTALGASNLTRALVPLGRFDEARTLIDEAIATTLAVDGAEHLQHARRLLDLGDLELAVGDLTAAQGAYRDSLELYRRLAGADSYQADTLCGRLGGVLRTAGRPEEAVAVAREVLGRPDGDRQERAPERAAARRVLVGALADLGRVGEASELAPRVVAEAERMYGVDSPRVAEALAAAAAAERAAGRPQDAVELLERAVRLRVAALGEDSWRTAESRLELGAALVAAGRPRSAEPVLRAAAGVLDATFGEDDHRVRRAGTLLATIR